MFGEGTGTSQALERRNLAKIAAKVFNLDRSKSRGRAQAVDPEVFHPCHRHLIMKHGIHLHEGMTFEGLVEREAYVFVYVFAPLPIVGATGSTGNPIAIL